MNTTYSLYQTLKRYIETNFSEIFLSVVYLGGTPLAPNKLRIYFKDNTFLDIWLSDDGDYSYHWEQRAKRGIIYRWDNAPDHPQIATHPDHFHDGSDKNVKESGISQDPKEAIDYILRLVKSSTMTSKQKKQKEVNE